MATNSRPDDFLRWDDNEDNQTEPSSALKLSGFPIGSPITFSKGVWNWLMRRASRWIRHIDVARFDPDRMVDSFTIEAGFVWSVVSGFDAQASAGSMYVGTSRVVRVEFTEAQLVAEGARPHTFAANMDTYIGVDELGNLEFQAVTNGGTPGTGTPPTPSAGFTHVSMVPTDGSGVSGDDIVDVLTRSRAHMVVGQLRAQNEGPKGNGGGIPAADVLFSGNLCRACGLISMDVANPGDISGESFGIKQATKVSSPSNAVRVEYQDTFASGKYPFPNVTNADPSNPYMFRLTNPTTTTIDVEIYTSGGSLVNPTTISPQFFFTAFGGVLA